MTESVIHYTTLSNLAILSGVWLFHCHIDTHLTWGLAMAFEVENGVGELQTLEPPPADLPRC